VSSALEPRSWVKPAVGSEGTEPLIAVVDLSRHYGSGDQAVIALDRVSLKIQAGECVAIMGPSGSGKSTFMNLIGCLDASSSGSYRLAGREVSGLSGNQLAQLRNRRIGFVFQQFNLLPRATALENVMLPLVYAGLPRAQREQRALARLRQVGLEQRLRHTPSQLSGGQQQRVAIARALVNDPSVLLADEPTGALDSKTSLEVMALFQDLNQQGQTVIFVTHENEVARFASRIVGFRDGRLVTDRSNPHDDARSLLAQAEPRQPT
jgi:putative ABC transport system ATP-binding protein